MPGLPNKTGITKKNHGDILEHALKNKILYENVLQYIKKKKM